MPEDYHFAITDHLFVAQSQYLQTAHKIMVFLSFHANMKPQYKLKHSVIDIDIITLLSYYHCHCCCHTTTAAAADTKTTMRTRTTAAATTTTTTITTTTMLLLLLLTTTTTTTAAAPPMSVGPKSCCKPNSTVPVVFYLFWLSNFLVGLK